MYNIPVVQKVKKCLSTGDVVGLTKYFDKYDFIIYPFSLTGAPSVSCTLIECVAQIEFYEIQLADFISRHLWCQHYVIQSTGRPRRRSLVVVGPDASLVPDIYQTLLGRLEDAYHRRYYRHDIKRGTAAATAYRAGFMEAAIAEVPYPDRIITEYQHLLDHVKLRYISSRSRKLSDERAREVGYRDGLTAELGVPNA